METRKSAAALREQLDYYNARAQEYDQWWLRQGRYDRGAEINQQWFAEVGTVSSALEAFRPNGNILELACGTGLWSERLLPFAARFTAVDGSPEMLAINAARLRSSRVRYIEANLFQWRPNERFDTVFFSFWLSHVPPERFSAFWELVRDGLAPGGRVFFIDSRYEATSTARDHVLTGASNTVQRRRLNDGRQFQVVKIYYDAVDLGERLRKLGWHFDIRQTSRYFIYGSGHPVRA